jgi:hypothetical protein
VVRPHRQSACSQSRAVCDARLLDRVLQHGRQRPAGGIFAAIPKPAPRDLDSAYAYLLGVPQPVIEHLLEEHAIDLGGEVRRGRAVTGFEQDELADGEQLRVRYLLGCDGARSTVRKQLGVAFPGEPSRTQTLTGEMEVGTAISIRYDFGAGPDLLGRRLRDIDLKRGHLYDRLHQGRGLVLDRTEGAPAHEKRPAPRRNGPQVGLSDRLVVTSASTTGVPPLRYAASAAFVNDDEGTDARG